MTDMFHPDFVTDEMLEQIFDVMRRARQHVFQTLTKQPARMLAFLESHPDLARDFGKNFPHVHLGVSVENQEFADKRRPYLERLRQLLGPEAVIWVSFEPALGKVDWTGWESLIDWMVCGGESKPKGVKRLARLMDPDWARAGRDFCTKHRIP